MPKNDGVCHTNSKYYPAVAEEYCATEVGKRLLLNEYGQYVGDYIVIFVDILVADNDTWYPKKIIQSQNQIIGSPADNNKEQFP